MFLRSLTLRGFKSFADKTTLEFTPGVSVIVGPNGSGKSNVADAIAWVLGEQGPRALRGTDMTDVIFAGSPGRPALGMAEVRMVIDNETGLIPVPASEIEIGRTVYRSGESEYRLGGRPCRLLDIQELLSDTGMGRALHTIIGQGQLDAVLQARPEERRQFVEEAAGIAKHRRRRERAERKLASLEQDLLRLQDLVGELKRQLRPLTQQAELAGRHEALSREAGDLARKLAAARLLDLEREAERRRPAWEEVEGRRLELQARLGAVDGAIAELEHELASSEGSERRAEELHASCMEAKSSAEEALRGAIREEALARERLASATNRAGRLFALEEELERTEQARAEVSASLLSRQAELDRAEADFRLAEQARRDAEDERRRIGEQQAAARAQADALGRALAGHQDELARLAAASGEVGDRLSSAQTRSVELEAEVERLDAHATPLSNELGSLEREGAGLAAAMASLEVEEKGLLARQEVAEARRAELSVSSGAAFIRRRGARAVGVLFDLIEAPESLRPALRTALGHFADAVVYASTEEALADAAAEPSGGVTLAVDGGPDHVLPSVYGERSLYMAVRPDPRIRRLIGQLIGEIYLANNMAEAVAKHRVHPYARFVTPDGAMAGPSFIRTSPGQDARLAQIRREAAGLERELARVRRGLREGGQRASEIRARTDAVRHELEATEAAITTAAEQMARVRADAAALHREDRMLSDRAAAVEAAAQAARLSLGELPRAHREMPPLPPFAEPPVRLRVEVEALRRDRVRLEAGVARARRDIDQLAHEDPMSLGERVRAVEEARMASEVALADADRSLASAAVALRATSDESRLVRERHAQANRTWRELAAEVERLRHDHEEEDRARRDLERRVGEAERVLREGHQIDPVEAVRLLDPGDTVQDLERRSDLVARRLGLVGRVNLLAPGELESVRERHDFLVRELEDVKSARRDLERVIEDVDRRVGELFQSAFSDVSREFASLFQLMFPGGEGRLFLTDPDDPLGSGIEVEARPGRGRVKRLSLLSGGERSLAALAFLFSIFRARPSPFYLMDEVEAALDDINLHRFLEVVKAFALDSQILVVTHQKRTMEMADVLYGVSMGRDGASAVISQRLAEAAVG